MAVQANYTTQPIVGANVDRRTAEPEFALGTISHGTNNRIYIYVVASGTVGTGTCTVTTGTWVVTDAVGSFNADTAFADGEYGWVRQIADVAA